MKYGPKPLTSREAYEAARARHTRGRPGSIITVTGPSTAPVAPRLSEDTCLAIGEATVFLSRVCDGALERDHQGWNKYDASSQFVNGMRQLAIEGRPYTQAQAGAMRVVLFKYKITQLQHLAARIWPVTP